MNIITYGETPARERNLKFVGHEVKKLSKFNGGITIGVDLSDDIVKFLFCWILIQPTDHC